MLQQVSNRDLGPICWRALVTFVGSAKHGTQEMELNAVSFFEHSPGRCADVVHNISSGVVCKTHQVF